ncbi:MAG: anaerobic ribonucleoside-triphosphate reductase, partial [Eggerthellaceae bacterium]
AYAAKNALGDTDRTTFQAMEALVHNLNTMHSRAGAQTPFSSVNYGMDTSPEGRMVVKNMLLATEEGLGSGETPIFPVQIFRVKEGVNYNPEDPNYDLFKLAMHCSAKRLFPNFSFIDAPFNAHTEGTPRRDRLWAAARASWATCTIPIARSLPAAATSALRPSTCAPPSARRATSICLDLLDASLLAVGQLDER